MAQAKVSPTELLDAVLAASAEINPQINAVVLTQEDVARRAIAKGLPRGPFTGIPFLLKDLGVEAVDFPSHNGSRLLANTRYDRDSAIYDRIRATGVVTWGRTTSPEGGVGAATESAVYGGRIQGVGPRDCPGAAQHLSSSSSHKFEPLGSTARSGRLCALRLPVGRGVRGDRSAVLSGKSVPMSERRSGSRLSRRAFLEAAKRAADDYS